MAVMLILLAALTATYQPDWNDSAAAWTTATFIWIYVGFFGASWGAFCVFSYIPLTPLTNRTRSRLVDGEQTPLRIRRMLT
jgi:hypothetical protein